YHGWTVHELPSNGQGIAALEMLNIMESFPLAEYGHNSTRALHTMIEAKKLAYADMIRYDADPKFAKIPVDGLKSKEFAKSRATRIDASKANCHVDAGTPPGTDNGTTYLSIVDRDGLFTLEKSHPNVLAPHKRPVHTIIPAFMQKGGVRIAFGIMGGWNQAQAHAQFVSNVVDFGMNIQGAIDAPRFSKETFPGCDVNIEARIPEKVRNELTALGHEIIPRA